jgi:hypothetical protein
MNAPMQQPLKPVRDARGKRPAFYAAPGMDKAMSMILVLANEWSVMRDRLDTLERVLAANGVDAPAAIEAYQPDQAVLEEREARRQDFLSRLYYLARKDAADARDGASDEAYRSTIEDIAKG